MDRDKSPVIMATEDSSPASSSTHLEVSATGRIDAQLVSRIRVQDLHAKDGAQLDVRGWVTLTGAHARLRIRPPGGQSKTPAGERTKLVPLVASGRTVPAARPEPSHVPLHARMALTAIDATERPLAPTHDTVCTEGELGVEVAVALPVRLTVRLDLRLDARTWQGQPAFVLTIRGELTIVDDLMLRLEFRPSNGSRNGSERGRLDWPVLAPGRRLNGGVRELTGITPGTWLMVRFLDARGAALDDERVVGRCVLP